MNISRVDLKQVARRNVAVSLTIVKLNDILNIQEDDTNGLSAVLASCKFFSISSVYLEVEVQDGRHVCPLWKTLKEQQQQHSVG